MLRNIFSARQNRRPHQQRLSIERLEDRTVPAGDVMTQVVGDTLIIEGDAADNAIEIRQDEPGEYRIVGVDGTTVDGQAEVTLAAEMDLLVDLGAGWDRLTLESLMVDRDAVFVDSEEVDFNAGAVGRDLSVMAAGGDNIAHSVMIDEATVGRDLSIAVGDALAAGVNSFGNSVQIGTTLVQRNLSVTTGDGAGDGVGNDVLMGAVIVQGNLSVTTGDGDGTGDPATGTGNAVTLSVVVVGDLTVTTGDGIGTSHGNRINLIVLGADAPATTIGGDLTVTTGDGIGTSEELITIGNSINLNRVVVSGNATLSTGDGIGDENGASDASGGNFVSLDLVDIGGDVTISTGAGAGAIGNSVSFPDLFPEHSTIDGDLTITIGDGTGSGFLLNIGNAVSIETLVVNGNVSITTGDGVGQAAGNIINVRELRHESFDSVGDLTITTGRGIATSEELITIGNSIGNSLEIGPIFITGNVSITTGHGTGGGMGNSVLIGNGLIGGSLTVTTGNGFGAIAGNSVNLISVFKVNSDETFTSLDGDVSVTVGDGSGHNPEFDTGDLILDGADNVIRIINVSADGDLTVATDNGDAKVLILAQEPFFELSPPPTNIGGNLRVTTGDGNDTVLVNSGIENVDLTDVTVRGKVRVKTGDGNDTVTLAQLKVGRRTLVLTGAGEDVITIANNVDFGWFAIVVTGPGKDIVVVGDTTYHANAVILKRRWGSDNPHVWVWPSKQREEIRSRDDSNSGRGSRESREMRTSRRRF